MALLDPPRHLAADLCDLFGEVSVALAVVAVDAVSRTGSRPHRDGPSPTRALVPPVSAGTTVAERRGGALDRSADALAGLVMGAAERAADLIVAVGRPREDARDTAGASGFVPGDGVRVRRLATGGRETSGDPRRRAGLRGAREPGG